MNALLNYSLPTLGLNNSANFGAYNNFMTPSFSGIQPNATFALPAALSNVPVGNYSIPSVNMTSSSQDSLKKLVKEGIISEDEYKESVRRMYGIFSEEEAKKASQTPDADFHGDDLKAARKSNKGDYKVTKEHSELAGKYLEVAKEILTKEPEMITEKELDTVEKIFAELNKNPMLSEAFVKEANNLTLSGKTKTLLGRYEQVLTTHHGQKAAKESIAEIKENLKQNVEGRNSKLWNEFEEKSDKDSKNVEYSFINKAMNNPGKVVGFTAAGVAGLAGARFISKKAIGEVAFKAANKRLLTAGKWGLAIAAVGAAAYGVYSLCSSETK